VLPLFQLVVRFGLSFRKIVSFNQFMLTLRPMANQQSAAVWAYSIHTRGLRQLYVPVARSDIISINLPANKIYPIAAEYKLRV